MNKKKKKKSLNTNQSNQTFGFKYKIRDRNPFFIRKCSTLNLKKSEYFSFLVKFQHLAMINYHNISNSISKIQAAIDLMNTKSNKMRFERAFKNKISACNLQ